MIEKKKTMVQINVQMIYQSSTTQNHNVNIIFYVFVLKFLHINNLHLYINEELTQILKSKFSF